MQRTAAETAFCSSTPSTPVFPVEPRGFIVLNSSCRSRAGSAESEVWRAAGRAASNQSKWVTSAGSYLPDPFPILPHGFQRREVASIEDMFCRLEHVAPFERVPGVAGADGDELQHA